MGYLCVLCANFVFFVLQKTTNVKAFQGYLTVNWVRKFEKIVHLLSYNTNPAYKKTLRPPILLYNLLSYYYFSVQQFLNM